MLLLLLVGLCLGLGVGVETPCWLIRLGCLLFLGRLEADLDVLSLDVLVISFLLLLEGPRTQTITLPARFLLLTDFTTCWLLLKPLLWIRLCQKGLFVRIKAVSLTVG